MLRQLRIENLVLARDVLLEFDDGLNLVTGETGAGKSLVVGALALVTGGRGESSWVRHGAERAAIEAIFDVAERPDVLERLARAGYAAEDGELLVRREIGADGRSRAFLAGSSVTLSLLRDLTAGLIEAHGQHEPQVLFQTDQQRSLIDRFGGHEEVLQQVRASWARLKDLEARRRELGERARQREGRIDTLRYRLGELDAVDPERGEVERLREERDRLRHAEEIGDALHQSVQMLYEAEGSALEQIHAASRRLQAQQTLGATFGELAERLDEVRAELSDIALELRSESENLAPDPARLAAVEERLSSLERLSRRFDGDSVDAILQQAGSMRGELEQLEGETSTEEEIGSRLGEELTRYLELARSLHDARVRAGHRLAEAVEGLLGQLAMKEAVVSVEIELDVPEDPGPEHVQAAGLDRVELMLQANPGEPARPLRRIASGGELSRVMLALDIALEGALSRRTLLFDEVDQGLGGDVADRLGELLSRVARRHQVINVTHLPQVAARAYRHFHVAKKTKSGRTEAAVRALDNEWDRVDELARMLGGTVAGGTAHRHAEQLLRDAQSQRTE
jgi:DNA repair protein RecN (Recombination protein N)